jgi:Flp pilus assembly protein TadD
MTEAELLQSAVEHHQAGRLGEAGRLYRDILTANPSSLRGWSMLGVVATQLNQFEAAAQCFQHAVRLDPSSAELHYNLGTVLQILRKGDESAAAFWRAIELNPNHAKARSNLSAVLNEQGKFQQAIVLIQEALRLDPTLPEAYCNLGNVLQASGQWEAAKEAFGRAIELKPGFAAARSNRAMVLLASGDFERGWPEYEWRWKTGQMPERQFAQPRWDGSSLAGRTILLYTEQGFGDTLQFIRYASIVKAMGAKVVVECPSGLTRLLVRCPGVDVVVPEGAELPEFDVQAPLLSLPGVLKTTVESIPASIPYLHTDPQLVELWRDRLAGLKGFRIGINWRGRPGQGAFRLRDVPLRYFAGLNDLPVSLVSLQHGATAEEFEAFGGGSVFRPGDDVDRSQGAFMDTAAMMMNLDLVITSDTSLPHLAGGLGVPVCVALPRVAGWQWMRDRQDSPWYPTVRLFRQRMAGDWDGVFQEIRRALVPLIENNSRGVA